MSCRIFITLVFVLATRAEIVDRIAVSVGNQVITTDQINAEIRATAFLNHTEPILTVEEKKKAAERLIEQTLLKREMDLTAYPQPVLADADPLLKLKQEEYPDRQSFLAALAHYGITEEDLRQRLWWQITLLQFLDDRFRSAVQVTTAEIQRHYKSQVSKWEEQGLKQIPSFEESRAAMEKAVTEERVDQAVERWLGDVRTRVDIRFRDGAFQ